MVFFTCIDKLCVKHAPWCHLTAFTANLCREGWSHVGEACLRINSSRESYDNARHYCKNQGGIIASLSTAKQVDFILEELQKYQQQDKVFIFVRVSARV